MPRVKAVEIVEVGPRDGFQPIGPMIPTERKIEMIRSLHQAGLRRMEATSFVSPKAVPQLADARAVLNAAQMLEGLDVQVLVPNKRYAEAALEAGANHLSFVLSVSEKHNLSNVRRLPSESVTDYTDTVAQLPPDIKVRLNLSTAFECPFDGEIPREQTLQLLEAVLAAKPEAEIALCDTTGRITADRVTALFEEINSRFPDGCWAFHGHDTYGQGIANVLAAIKAGIKVIDASFGGLGGCPFAPGATGNVATEDVVWTLTKMQIATGIDLDKLLIAAQAAAELPGAIPGGRVRQALKHSVCAA